MLVRTAKFVVAVFVLLLVATPVQGEMHWDVQAVNADGVGTFTGPATVIGVILNNHENMLDPTPDYNTTLKDLGGEWQIFVQSVDVRDHAGTACWMGQNCGNFPWVPPFQSYSDAEWTDEMNRLNYDPTTSHHFRAGDLVQVYARNTSFYGGKTNINEGHSKDILMNFDITLIEAGYGLPSPDLFTLSMVMGIDDSNPNTHEDIFEQTRLGGGEYFQGRYVRVNGLTMVDSNGWDKEEWDDRICTVTDGEGRIFKLRMPRGSMVDLGAVPTGQFDAIGIFNQESGSGLDGTFGYELYVTEVIPEPATMSLLLISGLMLLRKRKK